MSDERVRINFKLDPELDRRMRELLTSVYGVQDFMNEAVAAKLDGIQVQAMVNDGLVSVFRETGRLEQYADLMLNAIANQIIAYDFVGTESQELNEESQVEVEESQKEEPQDLNEETQVQPKDEPDDSQEIDEESQVEVEPQNVSDEDQIPIDDALEPEISTSDEQNEMSLDEVRETVGQKSLEEMRSHNEEMRSNSERQCMDELNNMDDQAVASEALKNGDVDLRSDEAFDTLING